MRLSRRVLATLGGVSAIAVAGALTFALWPHGAKGPGQELYSTDNRQTPDGLNACRATTADCPSRSRSLEPPLPGDLGKPILNAGAPTPGMPGAHPARPGSATLAQERQRLAQEMDAARTSRLFASEARAAMQPAAATGSGSQGGTAPLLDQGPTRSECRRRFSANGERPQARLPERSRRSAHHECGPGPGAGEPQRRPGRFGDPARADHRPALRPAGPRSQPR